MLGNENEASSNSNQSVASIVYLLHICLECWR